MQTRAVNPKAEVSYTTTLFGSQPTIKLDFSTYFVHAYSFY